MYGLAFLIGVVGEVASLVIAGSRLGAPWTLGLLVGSFAIGFALVSGRGAATIRTALVAVTHEASPAPALIDGVLIAIAGVLFITPGFVSDLIGLLIVLPPARAWLRDAFLRRALARLQTRLVIAPDDVRGDHVIDVESIEVPGRDDAAAPGRDDSHARSRLPGR